MLALLMMIKNEEKRILVSLNSVKGIVDHIFIYDTGSTDNTLEIIRSFCKENNIPLTLKEDVFVDFSTSRNKSLDLADETLSINDYLLLLDCNDELQGGKTLKEFVSKNEREDRAYMIKQKWWSGSNTEYYNVRLLKGKSGFRYKGVVHEYIYDTTTKNEGDWLKNPCKLPEDVILYQDRTADDNKSYSRFFRDRDLLEKEHSKNPEDPRTCFYLAQTYSCINEKEKAYEYYLKRTSLIGFYEERFHAYLRCGELAESLGKDWSVSLSHYLGAYEISDRIEPLLKITSYYRSKERWKLAYSFISAAISIEYPVNATLFVDPVLYNYTRYHLMGIIAYYAGKYKKGRKAVNKALQYNAHSDIDISNLNFYLTKERELNSKFPEKEEGKKKTKKEILKEEEEKIRKTVPSLKPNQVKSLALVNYKKSREAKKNLVKGKGVKENVKFL